MREDEHRTVLDGQFEERLLDLFAIGDPREIVGIVRSIDQVDRDLEPPSLGSPPLVGAGVDEESMEPGIETLAVTKTAQVPPGSDERILDRIFRGIPIAEDPSRDRVQPVVRGGREGIEGLVVAPLCAFDELGRHADPSFRRGHLPRSPSMASRCAKSFSRART